MLPYKENPQANTILKQQSDCRGRTENDEQVETEVTGDSVLAKVKALVSKVRNYLVKKKQKNEEIAELSGYQFTGRSKG